MVHIIVHPVSYCSFWKIDILPKKYLLIKIIGVIGVILTSATRVIFFKFILMSMFFKKIIMNYNFTEFILQATPPKSAKCSTLDW